MKSIVVRGLTPEEYFRRHGLLWPDVATPLLDQHAALIDVALCASRALPALLWTSHEMNIADRRALNDLQSALEALDRS
jgi:hypothetical protein